MKRTLRAEALKKRESIPLSERRIKDELIKRSLLDLVEYKIAGSLFSYVSFKGEVDTLRLIGESLKNGKRIVVPKVVKDMH